MSNIAKSPGLALGQNFSKQDLNKCLFVLNRAFFGLQMSNIDNQMRIFNSLFLPAYFSMPLLFLLLSLSVLLTK